MRPIDADKLPEHKFTFKTAKGSDYMRGWNHAIDAIVDNEPTVARPQGEWLEVKEEVHYDCFTVCECSLCKHSWALGELSIEDVKADYKFCPNCGADMRKEAENDNNNLK